MVGDVGGEVGEQAVLALDHAVLLVAEGGRAEPLGAVLHIQVAAGLPRLGDDAFSTRPVSNSERSENHLSRVTPNSSQIFAAVAELLGEGEAMHQA